MRLLIPTSFTCVIVCVEKEGLRERYPLRPVDIPNHLCEVFVREILHPVSSSHHRKGINRKYTQAVILGYTFPGWESSSELLHPHSILESQRVNLYSRLKRQNSSVEVLHQLEGITNELGTLGLTACIIILTHHRTPHTPPRHQENIN